MTQAAFGPVRVPEIPGHDGTNYTKAKPARYEDDVALLPELRRRKTLLDRAVELRIGDCVFAIPPEMIKMRTESRADKTYPLRHTSPMLTQAGYSEREIRATVYFTTAEEINGTPVPGPDGAIYYMDGLRPFLAMIRRSPLLPVKNEYINLVLDVWAVMIASLNIQTVDGFPGILAVEIVMRPASVEAYLMRHSSEFDEMVNWPLMRWNYQRAIADNMPWAETIHRLPPMVGQMDDTFGVQVVDVSRLGNDPWDKIDYVDYPLPDGIFVRSMSIQFQNVLAPLQTQMAEEPTYQFMGAMESSAIVQLECEDRTTAAVLVSLHQSILSQSREHHNRVVTSPLRIKSTLLNLVGIDHVMIEASDISTVPGFPGVSQLTLSLTGYRNDQGDQEKLESFNPGKQYDDVMHALQTLDPKNLNFIEQSQLAESYFQSTNLYPDLDLPTYGQLKKALEKINRQRGDLGLTPVPFAELNSMEWSDDSRLDPDFWMCYPGLGPGGIFELDTLNLPPQILELMQDQSVAGGLNANQSPLSKPEELSPDGLPNIARIDVINLPHLQYNDVHNYLTKKMKDIPTHSSLWKVAKSTNDYYKEQGITPPDVLQFDTDQEFGAMLSGVTDRFIHAQTETRISAAFWIALAAHESDWGRCDSTPGTAPSATWRGYNFYSLMAGTKNTSYEADGNGRFWQKFDSVGDGIARGADVVYREFYIIQRRLTLSQMVLTYVGDNEGDRSDWVKSIGVIIEDVIGKDFAAKNTDQARRKRAQIALGRAAKIWSRDYGSFDIMDGHSHLDPRQIADPEELLAATMQNMVRYGHRGRLSRAFPSFMLVFLDEGGMDRYARKVWTNFYMYHSLVSIDLIRERTNPADVLTMSMTNVYGTLNWRNRQPVPMLEGGLSTPLNFLERAWDGLFFNWDRNEYLLEYRKRLLTHFDVRPGMRVHLRMGYTSNPSIMPVVFNGTLMEMQIGDTIEVVAQSDGKELTNLVFDAARGSDPNAINHTVSGTLIELLTADSSSFIGHLLASTTGGDLVGSRQASATSRYGIEHFGPMKLDTVMLAFRQTQSQYERYKNIYPADFDSKLPEISPSRLTEMINTFVRWKDQYENVFFDQQNDFEKLVWIDGRGKSIWDVVKVSETVSPGYVGYPVYHGFDTRLFFGMPLWNVVYGWRMKRPRTPEERFDNEAKLPTSLFSEVYRPFQQFHYVNSLSDLIGNGIRTTSDFPTVAIGTYGLGGTSNADTPPQYADIHMRPDMQRTENVDLGMYQNLAGWDWAYEAMGITDTRAIAISATRNHLAKRMGDMYTGELMMLGDPSLAPHDVMHMVDTYWNLAGNVIIDKVMHHMSADGGFITVVEPKAIAMSKDEIKSNSDLASTFADFGITMGPAVRASIGIAAGLIAMGKLRALLSGSTALRAIGATVGDLAFGSTVLGGIGFVRLAAWTFRVGLNIIGFAFNPGKMLKLMDIKQYAEGISKAWKTVGAWAEAAAAEAEVGGVAAGVGAASEQIAVDLFGASALELQAATKLVTGLGSMGAFVIVWAVTSLVGYLYEGLMETYIRNRETIVLMPLSFHSGFLIAGLEAWQTLIPGYPDPKYVHVSSKFEAAAALDFSLRLRKSDFKGPIQHGFKGVSDDYGIPRNTPLGYHSGVDLKADLNTPIYPAAAGKVIEVSFDDTYGNYVVIEHLMQDNSIVTTKYAHMSETPHARVGQFVGPTTVIGKVGATGQATGPHLHLEFRVGGKLVNPNTYIVRY